jgi:hypothetical protein
MRWISNPLNSPTARALDAALHDSKLKIPLRLLCPCLPISLVSRGIEEPEAAARFLSPELADLHDPLRMSGMKSALVGWKRRWSAKRKF